MTKKYGKAKFEIGPHLSSLDLAIGQPTLKKRGACRLADDVKASVFKQREIWLMYAGIQLLNYPSGREYVSRF